MNKPGILDLADLACAAWKLQRRVSVLSTGDPEAPQFAAEISAICESLSRNGLEIVDHTGQGFDQGKALDVLAFEPAPEGSCPVIVETLRPTVYWHGTKIVAGLVVVAAPAPASNNTSPRRQSA